MTVKPDIQRKVSSLEEYLRSLRPIGAQSLDEYLANAERRFAAERLLELIV